MSVQIGGFTDIKQLKWAIVSSDQLISQLANLADALGFGWCGGTRVQYVGGDFDRSVSGDKYIAQAHYSSSDPYHDGYMADQRLKITLSNFQITIDPSTFTFDPTKATSGTLPDTSFATVFAKNYGDTADNVTQGMIYQLTDTVSHSVNVSFTEGVSVAVEAGVDIPFVADGKVTTTFSFSSTQGWEDSHQKSTGLQQTITYTGQVPAHSQRQLDLMVQTNTYSIPYTGTAKVDFQIDLYGFLRWGGNARHDHPGDRPFDTVTFGSDKTGGIADLVAKVDHKNIAGDWSWVDWSWVDKTYPGRVQGIAQALKGGVTAQIGGTFSDVRGMSAYIKAGDPGPIPSVVRAARSPDHDIETRAVDATGAVFVKAL